MSKKKVKEEFYIVKAKDVEIEKIIVLYDIHVYLENQRSFVLKAETEKEAKDIMADLWIMGHAKDLSVQKDRLIAISIIPRKKSRYWFEHCESKFY